ncbi:dsRBD fold-containing protein [Rhodococcus sp. NPDC059968]|uniref:dsRBD fold-containing protein n=1 Tax=Rhodococcus sp. NPDC059968 TaxID=3347017 RepID=UPI00366C2EC8
MSVSARARLPRPDDTALEGTGSARLHSTHFDVVTIGKQLAVARALADLSHQLFESASKYEAITRSALRLRHRTSAAAPPRVWSPATHASPGRQRSPSRR